MPCDKTDGAVVFPQLPCQMTTMTPNDELGLSLILSILSLYLDIFVYLHVYYCLCICIPTLHVYTIDCLCICISHEKTTRLPVVGLLAKREVGQGRRRENSYLWF